MPPSLPPSRRPRDADSVRRGVTLRGGAGAWDTRLWIAAAFCTLSSLAPLPLAHAQDATPGTPATPGSLPSPAALAPAQARTETARLEPDEQRELRHLMDDLNDAQAPLDRRRRAAMILLDHNWPAAVANLRAALYSSADPATVAAICQAVADHESPPRLLVAPLLKRLGSADAPTRSEVAAALGRFDDADLVAKLLALAQSPLTPLDQRVGATGALAGHRTQPVASALIQLAAASQPPALRAAALQSLTQLTGIDRFGQDAAAWDRWWDRASRWPADHWTQTILDNLAARNGDLGQQIRTLTSRLTDANNALYDQAAESARPALLQQMLADNLPDLRLLALKLIEGRVLNAQPVSDPVRVAMRSRLTDSSAAVRSRAAKLLENLADKPAAQRAAELVLAEPDPDVQVAQLGLLARFPSPESIEPALLLMDKPEVSSAAAGVLVAAHDAGMLDGAQADRALLAVKSHLRSDAKLDPMVLRLLGRIGSEQDQQIVLRALSDPDAQTRLAAADAYATPGHPLGPLLDHLSDPALRAMITQVIAQRGQDAASLMKLVQTPPPTEQPQSDWRSAVLAVASRLTLADLVRVDQFLTPMTDHRDLQEDVLKVAAGLTTPPALTGQAPPAPPAGDEAAERVRAEASLRLAELYLRNSEPGKAKAIQARLQLRTALTDDQHRRLSLSRLRRMLLQQSVDEAASFTESLIADARAGAPGAVVIDSLTPIWLDAADAAAKAHQPAAALAIAARAQQMLGPRMSDAQRQHLLDLTRPLHPTATAVTPTPSDSDPRSPRSPNVGSPSDPPANP